MENPRNPHLDLQLRQRGQRNADCDGIQAKWPRKGTIIYDVFLRPSIRSTGSSGRSVGRMNAVLLRGILPPKTRCDGQESARATR